MPARSAAFDATIQTSQASLNPRRSQNGVSFSGGSEPDHSRDEDGEEGRGIWSTILRGVASSRAVPTKNVIVLGDAHAGKSTLVNAIRQVNPADAIAEGDRASDDSHLGLSYSYMEVTEDDSEDVVARIGLYHLASDAAYQALVRLPLNLDTLADSLVVLVLDWTRPWLFLQSLDRWLTVLEREVNGMMEQRRRLVFELREKLEAYVRSYTEPADPAQGGGKSSVANGSDAASKSDGTASAASAQQHSVVLPLSPGVLTTNLGIPIVVVASKSDATIGLERERDYKEEQFDFIQQSLRTICLRYGAALFYTSTYHPHTITNLRSYILHRLLGAPAPSTSTQTSSAGMPSSFGFDVRARVVDRDTVLVPTGWDSWGKIRVLREGFDCASMAGLEGEEEGKRKVDSSQDGGALEGPRAIYEEVVKNPGATKALSVNATITAEDEQSFLERHLEILSVSAPGGMTTGVTTPAAVMSPGASSASMMPGVGGMVEAAGPSARVSSTSTSSSLLGNDPMEDVSVKLARLAKIKERDAAAAAAAREKLKFATADLPLPPSLSAATSTPPLHDPTSDPRRSAGLSSVAPISAQQNEVLANFFQSLLAKKGQVAGVTAPTPAGGAPATPSGANGAVASSPGANARPPVGLAGDGSPAAAANGVVAGSRERGSSMSSNASGA
ncbi:hypothetical protein HK104_009391 [Borealophlyctis nickersoniae]|nr:hypothetical protein HK104_009391 [Borealophlyctis nickersoniae]